MKTWVFRLTGVHCGSIRWGRAKLGFILSLYSVLQQTYALCGGYSNHCVPGSESNLCMNARFDVTEHSIFVEYDAVSLAYWFLTSKRIALPSSSRT